MIWRKVFAAFLAVVALSPVWAASEPLGNITFSAASTVRDMKLTPGSTVFSGDVISVAAKGAARIALTGGAQAEILSNSSVRITKAGGSVQMAVVRGQASFLTPGGSAISALVADATVRPVDGAESSGVIQSLSESHAVVAAMKGSLLLTTAHDGKTYTLLEGQAADLSVADDPPQNGGAAPAGKSAPALGTSSKKAVY